MGNPKTTAVDWRDIKSKFPIKRQPQADEAAKLLLAVPANDPDYWRAQAWFAYLCATAVLDWWDFSGADWGDWANLPRPTFWAQAAELADEAVEETRDKNDRYDAFWARGFIAVAEGRYVDAFDDYILATAYGGKKKDAAVYAEAADAAVFAGDIAQARAWIDQAFATLPNPADAPDWFYWVRAWVAVAEGVQHPDGSGERTNKAVQAIADIDAMPLDNDGTMPKEFDAVVTKELALFLKDKAPDKALWAEFLKKVKNRKGMVWNKHLELARSPFNNEVVGLGDLRWLLTATFDSF